jgi:hypothetical protein
MKSDTHVCTDACGADCPHKAEHHGHDTDAMGHDDASPGDAEDKD